MTAADRPSSRDEILRVAIDIIDEHGEAALRMADVAERAGVAIALISHHFMSREGLITEAQMTRFLRQPFLDNARIEAGVMATQDLATFRAGMRVLTREIVSAGRAVFRMERVTVIASSYGRAELSERLRVATGEITDSFERVVALAQRVAFVRADLDARAIALAVQAYAMGLVVADLDPARPDDERIAEVIDAFLDGVFVVE
jgi:AcrR family transcriptional regulator